MTNIDPATHTQIDAETAQAYEDATQAAYEAKPVCEKCGHHPGDALHACVTPEMMAAERPTPDALLTVTPSRILAPDGTPAIQASEVESMGQPTLADFLEIVDKWGSALMTPGERMRQARLLMARHPLIDRAYRDGLERGRDLRERAKRGLGWTWPSLEVLTPREIGFVMARVRSVIGVKE